jgi:hypothetical protein
VQPERMWDEHGTEHCQVLAQLEADAGDCVVAAGPDEGVLLADRISEQIARARAAVELAEARVRAARLMRAPV